jgi:hypothetical protein
VDDGDAGRLGLADVGEADHAAIQPDLALISCMDAGQDLHQRRFAGAVLAHQRVDFAFAQLEARVAQRSDAAEVLADCEGRQERRLGPASIRAGSVIDSRSGHDSFGLPSNCWCVFP